MFAEAETMRDLFAEEYEQFSRHVPLFVPRFTAYRAASMNSEGAISHRSQLASQRRFDLSLYLRHREYRAALGFVVAYALLAAKLAIAAAKNAGRAICVVRIMTCMFRRVTHSAALMLFMLNLTAAQTSPEKLAFTPPPVADPLLFKIGRRFITT